jgi:ankyrin repeat protein
LPTAQLDIAATLLRVLSFRCFNSGPPPEMYMGRMIRGAFNEKKIRDHVVLHYAATFWHHHVSFVEPELIDLMTAFLTHPNLILSAMQIQRFPFLLDLAWCNYEHTWRSFSALHVTSWYSLSRMNSVLLEQENDRSVSIVDAVDVRSFTPLKMAAAHGHRGVMNILIDHGADIPFKSKDNRNALWFAVHGRHLEIVKFLVENHVEVNTGDVSTGTATCIAAWSGDSTILKRLLDNGADINGQGRYTRSLTEHALNVAAAKNYEPIVELLLEREPM